MFTIDPEFKARINKLTDRVKEIAEKAASARPSNRSTIKVDAIFERLEKKLGTTFEKLDEVFEDLETQFSAWQDAAPRPEKIGPKVTGPWKVRKPKVIGDDYQPFRIINAEKGMVFEVRAIREAYAIADELNSLVNQIANLSQTSHRKTEKKK